MTAERSGEKHMIPISVSVSRETGKVVSVKYAEGTEEDAARMGRALIRIARTARRTLPELRKDEAV